MDTTAYLEKHLLSIIPEAMATTIIYSGIWSKLKFIILIFLKIDSNSDESNSPETVKQKSNKKSDWDWEDSSWDNSANQNSYQDSSTSKKKGKQNVSSFDDDNWESLTSSKKD